MTDDKTKNQRAESRHKDQAQEPAPREPEVEQLDEEALDRVLKDCPL